MSRLFIFDKINIGGEITVSGDDVHHLIRVLRYGLGDEVRISDGKNTEALGVITGINTHKSEIKLKIMAKHKNKESKHFITLLQGLPKGEKFDWILQKNTEIGVKRFIPTITQRTVVNLTQSRIMHRKERWERIVKEAAKQSMRIDVPVVDKVLPFENALNEIKNHQLIILPWEREKQTSLKRIITDIASDVSKIAVIIGPEGGFSLDEVEKARNVGAVTVNLGSNILRTETAAVATCSVIQYELGYMGG